MFEVTTDQGQKWFAVANYIAMHRQVLEQDNNDQAWQVLQGSFAECQANAVEFLNAKSASSSHPVHGAGPADPDEEAPNE